MIFVKVKEAVDFPTKNGFKKKVDLLQESAECKKLWLEYKFHEDNESYPRLGESTIKPYREKHKLKQKIIDEQEAKRKQEAKIVEMKKKEIEKMKQAEEIKKQKQLNKLFE